MKIHRDHLRTENQTTNRYFSLWYRKRPACLQSWFPQIFASFTTLILHASLWLNIFQSFFHVTALVFFPLNTSCLTRHVYTLRFRRRLCADLVRWRTAKCYPKTWRWNMHRWIRMEIVWTLGETTKSCSDNVLPTTRNDLVLIPKTRLQHDLLMILDRHFFCCTHDATSKNYTAAEPGGLPGICSLVSGCQLVGTTLGSWRSWSWSTALGAGLWYSFVSGLDQVGLQRALSKKMCSD